MDMKRVYRDESTKEGKTFWDVMESIASRTRSKFVRFLREGTSRSGKTGVWSVVEKETGGHLGEVKWFARWRCYAFFPWEGTIYEQVCLRDIADFCERCTERHRKRL